MERNNVYSGGHDCLATIICAPKHRVNHFQITDLSNSVDLRRNQHPAYMKVRSDIADGDCGELLPLLQGLLTSWDSDFADFIRLS